MSSLPDRRASDADRQRTMTVLRGYASNGVLTLDELEDRLGLVFKARTMNELVAIVADLADEEPIVHEPRPVPWRVRRRRMWRNQGFQYHATAYGLTNGLLMGTWALTGADFFWPFFPAAGWGIGIVMHGLAIRNKPDREELRAASLRQREAATVQPDRPPARLIRPNRLPLRGVTVMFVDVANSTALTEALGDVEWSRLRSRHTQLLRDCFQSNEGIEVGLQGDGALARFDTPASAVRCAVEIQRRLEVQRDGGFAPTVRIGIHSGEAVEEDDGDLIGKVVNLCSRVTAEADPGEILVTEPVAEHVEGRFELMDRGLRTLRGVSRPRHLLAVDWQ